jgi:hypothetical protein
MKKDEMTICECIEYLDSMVGDDENIKGCLDYIERKAKAMDKKLRDYKSIFEEEHPLDGNSFGFLYFKMYSNSTLKRMTKDWLKQPHEKPIYKLTKFEKELLECYSDVYSFKVFNSLNGMKEKGYFKGIDDNELIGDILAKCEVVG